MNICLKCQSAYEKPGTCNCFAEKQQTQTIPNPVVIPYQPFYPTYPGAPGTTAPVYPWWQYQITCDSFCT